MNELLKEAKSIEAELIQMRRELHQIPEIGIELPKTAAYVKAKLIEYGYEPTEIYTNAIVATVGKASPTRLPNRFRTSCLFRHIQLTVAARSRSM